MKILSKIALGAVVALIITGCGESAKFGDKEYTHDYLNDRGNSKLLVELVEFCEANKNADLSTMQMKNCEMGEFVKSKRNKSFNALSDKKEPTEWDELVEKYGSKAKK